MTYNCLWTKAYPTTHNDVVIDGVTQIMKTLNLFHAIVLCLKTDRFFYICLNKPFFVIAIKFDLDLTKTLDIAF